MDYTINQWRYMYELSEYPSRIEANRDLYPEATAQVEDELVKLGVLDLNGEEIPALTKDGLSTVAVIKEQADELLRGVPVEARPPATIQPSRMLSFYPIEMKWYRTKIQNVVCLVPPDAGGIFPGAITYVHKSLRKRITDLNKDDRKQIMNFVKSTAGSKDLVLLEPYAYQLGSIGGPYLIIMRSENGDFSVPMQTHFYDWISKRYPKAKWYSIPGVETSIPLVARSDKRSSASRIYDCNAVVMAAENTPTWTWTPPEF